MAKRRKARRLKGIKALQRLRREVDAARRELDKTTIRLKRAESIAKSPPIRGFVIN